MNHKITVYIKYNETKSFEFNDETKVEHALHKALDEFGIPKSDANKWMLTFDTAPLDNGAKLKDQGVHEGSTLKLASRLPGTDG